MSVDIAARRLLLKRWDGRTLTLPVPFRDAYSGVVTGVPFLLRAHGAEPTRRYTRTPTTPS